MLDVDLRLEVVLQDSSGILNCFPASGEPAQFRIMIGRIQLRRELSLLREDLLRAKIIIAREESNDIAVAWERLSKAFGLLHRRGCLLALRLFGFQLPQVINLFNNIHPLWSSGLSAQPFIEAISTVDDIIPFELLPLFSTANPQQINSFPSMENVARRFIGYSAFVSRRIRDLPVSQDHVLENTEGLPLKFFYHAGLEGAERELNFFRGLGDLVRLQGPWPKSGPEGLDLAEELAAHLWDPCRGINGKSRDNPDQILHFACHCESVGLGSSENFLILAHTASYPQKVHLVSLEENLASFASHQQRTEGALPLVFVNACGSASDDSFHTSSFRSFFLKLNGNRGFIGSETRVPDKFAFLFSKYFYSSVLSGDRLDQAMFSARWLCLRRHRNPLGLLYSAFAAPEIRVRKPTKTDLNNMN